MGWLDSIGDFVSDVSKVVAPIATAVNPMAGVISAGIGAVGNYISTKDTNATNQQIANATNIANMELAKYQNQANVELWREQSEYNNPTNTMQRLVDAGINPRAYNQLGQFANAATPPQMQRAEMKGYQYRSPLGSFSNLFSDTMEYKRKEKEIELLDAQARATLANAGLKEEQKTTEGTRRNYYQSLIDNAGIQSDILQATVDKMHQDYLFNAREFNIRMHKLGVTVDKDGIVHFPEELKGIEAKKEQQIISDLAARIASAQSVADLNNAMAAVYQVEKEMKERKNQGLEEYSTPFLEALVSYLPTVAEGISWLIPGGAILRGGKALWKGGHTLWKTWRAGNAAKAAADAYSRIPKSQQFY